MNVNYIDWKENGWIVIQDADSKKHLLEISCRAENGEIVETRIRHNDGEEAKGNVVYEGKKALPMSVERFKKLYTQGLLEIK